MTKEVAQILLKRISTVELCRVYDGTADRTTHDTIMEAALIRGWVMAELKRRDKHAYKLWIGDRADSPTPYFVDDDDDDDAELDLTMEHRQSIASRGYRSVEKLEKT